MGGQLSSVDERVDGGVGYPGGCSGWRDGEGVTKRHFAGHEEEESAERGQEECDGTLKEANGRGKRRVLSSAHRPWPDTKHGSPPAPLSLRQVNTLPPTCFPKLTTESWRFTLSMPSLWISSFLPFRVYTPEKSPPGPAITFCEEG